MAERRAQLQALARELRHRARRHRDASVEPLAGPADHRHAALPPERRAAALRRLAQQHLRPPCPRRHPGADRAIAVHNALRNFLPELLALSASSPFVEEVDIGLHSARTQIFTRMFPRCGIPDAYDGWQGFEDYVAFLYRTGSIDEHTQLWWSVRPHLAYPDDRDPHLRRASPTWPRRSRSQRSPTRWPSRCARAIDEGEPLPDLPHRLLEENLWRAIRYGLSGELIDFDRGEPVPARARLEQLLEWVAPVADEIGAAPFLDVPARNAAERQIARFDEGASLRGDLRRAGAQSESRGATIRWLTRPDRRDRRRRRSQEQLAAFERRAVPRLAPPRRSRSLAYAKLERRDFDGGDAAIDALAALLPLLEGELADDLAQALAQSAVAYSDAAAEPLKASRPELVIHNRPRRSPRRLTL